MPFPLPAARLELQRGRLVTLAFQPLVGETPITSGVTGQGITVYDPAGTVVATPTSSFAAATGITASWTPAASLPLASDYRYDVNWSVGGASYLDAVYFDLVRVPLRCPVTQQSLAAIEPVVEQIAVPNLTATHIAAAWAMIRQRINLAGARPRLCTTEDAFALPATYLALSLLFASMQRATGDVWESKRDYYREQYEATWGALQPLQFEVLSDGEATGTDTRQALPGFRI